MQNNNNSYTVGFILIIVFLSIFVLNRLTPIYADDWVYMGVFGANHFQPINNIADIFESQYNHYFLWGGRTVVHFIDQLLLFFKEPWLSIFKSLFFILYIFILYKYSSIKNDAYNALLVLFISVIIYSFIPYFEEIILWTTGTVNYLFGITIALIFLYPFYKYYIIGKDVLKVKYNYVLIFIFGIIAGWTNESTGATLIFILCLLLVYLYKFNIQIPKWIIAGFAGFFIGYLLMILAPGNYARLTIEQSNSCLAEPSFKEIILFRIKNVFYHYTQNIHAVFLLFFSIVNIVVVTYFFKKNNLIDRRKIYASILFFISGNFSSIVMLAAPIYPIRASFPMITFFILTISITTSELIKIPKTRNFIIIMLTFFIVFFIRRYYFMYSKITIINQEILARDKYVEEQKKIGNLDIILEERKIPHPFFHVDFSSDENYLTNKAYSDVYGLNSIKSVSKKDYKLDSIR